MLLSVCMSGHACCSINYAKGTDTSIAHTTYVYKLYRYIHIPITGYGGHPKVPRSEATLPQTEATVHIYNCIVTEHLHMHTCIYTNLQLFQKWQCHWPRTQIRQHLSSTRSLCHPYHLPHSSQDCTDFGIYTHGRLMGSGQMHDCRAA